ncbi:MAG: anthranilate phosphoribosyltransferase, anthranilate phosphoribosyltransferase [Candidatus Gottesmanbacteria bacterium GW2011_GWA2_43_14]|uniref:Anthranilate phosphoribosyltransferase n=1 Tax=Candidatus Gottesmanbacteria bacterium GW2011_GWA2_43_14 TaxID=1618443 RepID=A0A0G1GGK9_9BACT|nr:MAG: anthranilate phosphoribosyltransferase, anthranilate phosphoribosyltransferase [Candidatus Gottesmanbacteria bacterium GW2011_GWA2_43_14]
MNLNDYLKKITAGVNLSRNESEELAGLLLNHSPEDSVKAGAVLTALKMKGETVEEILGFVHILRKEMIKVPVEGLIVDTCGTGGDGQQTFNISTAAALVAAACGVMVAKHGNRKVSGSVGSADVLEGLAVKINLSPEAASKCLEKIKFAFLFAPNFHPALKTIGAIRQQLKISTIFNLLGPLLNPAGVKRQLIGVPSLETAEKLSQVVKKLDYEHVLVVCAEDGLDEISLYARTHIFEIKNGRIRRFILDPKSLGIKSKNKESIKGINRKHNAGMILDILKGNPGDPREIVILNAAAVLTVVAAAKNFKEGIMLARQAVDSGKALEIYKKFKALTYELSD